MNRAKPLLLSCLLLTAWTRSLCAQEILVKDGQKIAFLGDSITQMGQDGLGYCQLVISGLKANGVGATMVRAGISGHTSRDMLARVERDVINKKPDWMTLSCGVNDVWHGAGGVVLDKYKENITAIVDKVTAAGIKVVILTSTMIGEDQPNGNNQKLVAYNDFLKSLAAERKFPLADLNADMQATIKDFGPHQGNLLTRDGVHMNGFGDVMMASGVLKAFGLGAEQLAKAKADWDAKGVRVAGPQMSFTLAQIDQLKAAAAKQGKSVGDLVMAAFNAAMDGLLKQ
jgi:lysophospholipase L1-like esterase